MFHPMYAQAVKLAKQSVSDGKVYIAGSNAPAEDCYQATRTLSHKELQMNHCKHIDLLMDNGVNFILNETQSHFDEIKIICDHCDKNGIPYVISLYIDENKLLLSGEKLESVFSRLNDSRYLLSVSTVYHRNHLSKVIGSTKLPNNWGFYLNCGNGQPSDKIIDCGIQPDEYLEVSKKTSLNFNPSFVGSCCGSNPAHTKTIREYLDGKIGS